MMLSPDTETWKWKLFTCVTLCDPMDYKAHGVLQARILEWVAVPFSRVSSQARDQTQVFHLASVFFTIWATRKAIYGLLLLLLPQSCPTLCDPIDGSPPGSPVPGTLQARTLEWVAISFSNAWKWKVTGKSLSCVRLLATPWTAAYQAPPSMGFSRQEYWSGVPLPSPAKWVYSSFNHSFISDRCIEQQPNAYHSAPCYDWKMNQPFLYPVLIQHQALYLFLHEAFIFIFVVVEV